MSTSLRTIDPARDTPVSVEEAYFVVCDWLHAFSLMQNINRHTASLAHRLFTQFVVRNDAGQDAWFTLATACLLVANGMLDMDADALMKCIKNELPCTVKLKDVPSMRDLIEERVAEMSDTSCVLSIIDARLKSMEPQLESLGIDCFDSVKNAADMLAGVASTSLDIGRTWSVDDIGNACVNQALLKFACVNQASLNFENWPFTREGSESETMETALCSAFTACTNRSKCLVAGIWSTPAHAHVFKRFCVY